MNNCAADWVKNSATSRQKIRLHRHMAFMFTGQQIDLMNESSTAEHLSMELTHYRQMPDGPAEIRKQVQP